ncbi:MAG: Asp-tRNA(Asn)/Glu-tRNA(Gln) amidotransferase subunit GatC [Candidatus Nezhaarchaeota archaeon]|nr:Asp-tRNA(Asn)/Glu-tRNA(Gln) amidotransferase subunit GatC [Candidatus Nezhaarchaeota archaeon]MCX8141521.1 Asp-tRNA(Asn)/Glu-tRNA(Gln) amidotransferase subunit GatC [Candidatus Nezhaarchaeota archaeon]MDW8049788.1 Asp-tRNA(Asn)/Glu-tRNA(Gln) amidotransferase subunit GatC [Nitrososphaerota archaeon]
MTEAKEIKITPELLDYLSKLAKIKLREDEKAVFLKDLNRILEYFSILDEVEASDVEPAFHVIGLSNIARDDEVGGEPLTQDEALLNAPHKEEGYIKAPRMV